MAGGSNSELTLSVIRAGDRNYVSAKSKMLFSTDDCNIQRWISPVVSTCLGVLGTSFCNSGLRAMRRNSGTAVIRL